MTDVVTSTAIVVPDVVALEAISDWVVTVVTGAFRGKADADRRFVTRAAILELTSCLVDFGKTDFGNTYCSCNLIL